MEQTHRKIQGIIHVYIIYTLMYIFYNNNWKKYLETKKGVVMESYEWGEEYLRQNGRAMPLLGKESQTEMGCEGPIK